MAAKLIPDSKDATKGERTRMAIAETAIEILDNEGYQALTVAALADGAGIRRNSFYTHFQDLDDVLDLLSGQVLNSIGGRTLPRTAPAEEGASVVVSRLQYVVSLRTTDPLTAVVLSELYVHHAATASEVHRRLVLDFAADRRRGVLGVPRRDAELMAVMFAASVMELLRTRHPRARGEDARFIELIERTSGLAAR